MSLYENTEGGGSIWSNGSIFFNSQSAINDILEKDDCSLDDILKEEDLLQELKGLNVKLLNFLESTENLAKIIEYFTVPGSVKSDDASHVRRFPFIACEVFMCDVKQITSKAMAWKENGLLKQILSVLDASPEDLTSQCAGYFSKVFQLLARRHPKEMMSYWESAGPKIMDSFLSHLGSFSVMEALRCILNLKVEMAVLGCTNDGDVSMGVLTSASSHETTFSDDTSTKEVQKDDEDMWLQSPLVISKLLACLSTSSDPDVHDNVAEVIGYFCGSDMMPRNDEMITFLESKESCESLIAALCCDAAAAAKDDDTGAVASKEGESSKSEEGVDTSSRVATLRIVLRLLESFLLQQQQQSDTNAMGDDFLGDAPYDMESGETKIKLSSELPPIARMMLERSAQVCAVLGDKRFRKRKCTDGSVRPMVGEVRRLLVDVVSHIVIMASSSLSPGARTKVCADLAKSGLVPICFDLFFQFENCNIVHNHVINILMHIVSRAHMEPVAVPLFRRASASNGASKDGDNDDADGKDDSYDLLSRILREYEANKTLLEGSGDSKCLVAKGNYGHLHKFANIVVEASQLPTMASANGTDDVKDASGAAMMAPEALVSAVKSCSEWQSFVAGELQRINEAGASVSETPDVSGIGDIASPDDGGDFTNEFDDGGSWMEESGDAIDDLNPDMAAAMMHRAQINVDLNSSDEDVSSGSDDDVIIRDSSGAAAGGDEEKEEEEEDTSWANFDDFPEGDAEDYGDA